MTKEIASFEELMTLAKTIRERADKMCLDESGQPLFETIPKEITDLEDCVIKAASPDVMKSFDQVINLTNTMASIESTERCLRMLIDYELFGNTNKAFFMIKELKKIKEKGLRALTLDMLEWIKKETGFNKTKNDPGNDFNALEINQRREHLAEVSDIHIPDHILAIINTDSLPPGEDLGTEPIGECTDGEILAFQLMRVIAEEINAREKLDCENCTFDHDGDEVRPCIEVSLDYEEKMLIYSWIEEDVWSVIGKRLSPHPINLSIGLNWDIFPTPPPSSLNIFSVLP